MMPSPPIKTQRLVRIDDWGTALPMPSLHCLIAVRLCWCSNRCCSGRFVLLNGLQPAVLNAQSLPAPLGALLLRARVLHPLSRLCFRCPCTYSRLISNRHIYYVYIYSLLHLLQTLSPSGYTAASSQVVSTAWHSFPRSVAQFRLLPLMLEPQLQPAQSVHTTSARMLTCGTCSDCASSSSSPPP